MSWDLGRHPDLVDDDEEEEDEEEDVVEGYDEENKTEGAYIPDTGDGEPEETDDGADDGGWFSGLGDNKKTRDDYAQLFGDIYWKVTTVPAILFLICGVTALTAPLDWIRWFPSVFQDGGQVDGELVRQFVSVYPSIPWMALGAAIVMSVHANPDFADEDDEE